ncbi:hypothetical protein TWF569_003463 [Orbilia oligospora]|nr:hypothetical protein TWF706_007899 [Orbilia oligospora]KAF3151746.1 hypothetical protein TWF569_003463 [Orbilia oligospora]
MLVLVKPRGGHVSIDMSQEPIYQSGTKLISSYFLYFSSIENGYVQNQSQDILKGRLTPSFELSIPCILIFKLTEDKNVASHSVPTFDARNKEQRCKKFASRKATITSFRQARPHRYTCSTFLPF